MRRLTFVVYALLLFGETLWAALVPLVPTYQARLGLSSTETGVLAAAASVSILIVSLPAGVLADRIGSYRLTVCAGLVIGVSAIAQASVSDSFAGLLATRAVFGIGFGMLWSAGLAMLADSVPPEIRTRALARTMLVAGAGTTLGPSLAGSLADQFGLGAPFLAGGVVVLLATAAVAVSGRGTVSEPQHEPLRAALRRSSREPYVVGALVFMTTGGLLANGINLIVPLDLRDAHLSAGRIGLAFSAASAIFIAASLMIGRHADRTARLSFGGLAALLFTVLLALPVISSAAVPLIAFLVLRAPLTAALFTISFPIGVRGAERAAIGRGAILGLLNAFWAATAVIAPPATGALRDSLGERAPWVALALVAAAAAAWASLAATRDREPAGRAAWAGDGGS